MDAGKSIKEIFNNSKMVFLIIGKDEDFDSDFITLTLYGHDNFLRNYIYIYGSWYKNYTPLHLGIENLKLISNNLDVRFFIDVTKKAYSIYPCKDFNAWISSIPMTNEFKSIVSNSKQLAKILMETSFEE